MTECRWWWWTGAMAFKNFFGSLPVKRKKWDLRALYNLIEKWSSCVPKVGSFYLLSFVLSQSNIFLHCLQIVCNLCISTFIHISVPVYKSFWMHRSEILPPLLTFSSFSPCFSLNLYFWSECTDSFIELKNFRMCSSTRNECVLLYADWS